jgi:hypothetical protein
MQQPLLTPVTYRELCLYPDDLKRRELIDGEVIVSAAPLNPHQKVVGNIHIIVLDPDEVFRPAFG